MFPQFSSQKLPIFLQNFFCNWEFFFKNLWDFGLKSSKIRRIDYLKWTEDKDKDGYLGKNLWRTKIFETSLQHSFRFQTRTQNRPHAQAQRVLRGSKGSGTSMAIRVSGPFDQSALGMSMKSVLSSGLKPKLTYTTPGAIWSNGPLTPMAMEVPDPFNPLGTCWAWAWGLFWGLVWNLNSPLLLWGHSGQMGHLPWWP